MHVVISPQEEVKTKWNLLKIQEGDIFLSCANAMVAWRRTICEHKYNEDMTELEGVICVQSSSSHNCCSV